MNPDIAKQMLLRLNQLRRLDRQSAPAIDPLRGQGYVLYHLCHRGGNALPGELSAELGISTPRMTSILTSLEKQGLLSRQMSPSDRRKIIVSLTKEGRELVQMHDAQAYRELSAFLETLGEEEASHCLSLLDKALRYRQAQIDGTPSR